MVLLVQKKHVEKPTTECSTGRLWRAFISFCGMFLMAASFVDHNYHKTRNSNQAKTSIIQRNQYIIHQYNYCCTASTIAFRLKFHIDHPLIVFNRT